MFFKTCDVPGRVPCYRSASRWEARSAVGPHRVRRQGVALMFDSGPEVQCIELNPRLRRGRLRQSAHGTRACLILCWMRVLRTMPAEGPAMAHIPESLQVMEPGRRHSSAALAATSTGPSGVRTPQSPFHSAVRWLVRARVTLFRCRRTSVRVRPSWAR